MTAIVFCASLCVLPDKIALASEEVKPARVVAKLSADQIKQFSRMVRMRDLRRQELAVLSRIWEEKRREAKAFADEMAAEFEMSPESAYTYETKSKTLYRLSTNRLDKAGKPERKVARKVKSDSESQYLSRLMVARKLTEQQIGVLAQLRAEKAKEAQLQDDKLRETFKLEAGAGYRLDEKTGEVFLVPGQADKSTKN